MYTGLDVLADYETKHHLERAHGYHCAKRLLRNASSDTTHQSKPPRKKLEKSRQKRLTVRHRQQRQGSEAVAVGPRDGIRQLL